MNVLYGLYAPDEGEILVDDEPVTFRGPGDAMAAGIGMVHQHFMLIPVFTVAENVMLGHEETRRIGFLDRRRARRDVEEISKRYRLDVPPDALVARPPGGRAAARRDHQGAQPRRARAHPRRADRRAHPAGDRRPDPRHARPARRRHVDRVHHAQAARGARGRRPDHGDPARQGRRQRVADGVDDRARVADGRTAGAAHRGQGRRASPPTSSSTSTASPCSTRRGVVLVDDVSFQVRGGEIYALAGRAGQRADRDDRGAGRADDPDVGQDHDRGLGRHHALHRRGARPRRRLRARGPAARRAGRRLLRRREPRARPLRPAAVRVRARDEPRRRSRATPPSGSTSSTCARPSTTAVGQHALGRQPAEGGARARAVAAAEAADRRAADARPRRRLDGVRAPADRGRARPGRGRRADLHRAGRGARAGRPDRRDVPGQDRGRGRREARAPRRSGC